MAQFSESSLASAVLVHLGRDQIADLDSNEDPEARLIRERLPAVRNALLRTYPWNCAMQFASLPGSKLNVPMFGYTHRCPLPAGGDKNPKCLKLWTVDTDAKYALQGKYLYLSAAPPVAISYVGEITNVQEFDPLLYELLALDLALALINRIPSGDIRKTRRDLQAERKGKRREARLSDAMEASPMALARGSSGSWIAARRPK